MHHNKDKMSHLREILKKNPFLKKLVISLRLLRNKPSFTKKISLIFDFHKDYKIYKKSPTNPHWELKDSRLYPCIYDKTQNHNLDPVYFYQNSWCAGKIFADKPSHHYDVGSQAHLLGILSQFTKVTMIDIRPITLKSLSGLYFIKGDITHLPFKEKELSSLSSICVIEHIGLGRYGDMIDQFGSEKAARELIRVLAPGGNLYISVPVDDTTRVYFNAHRAFTRDRVLEIFKDLSLKEEQYIYGNKMERSYDPSKGFGTGLYHFARPL